MKRYNYDDDDFQDENLFPDTGDDDDAEEMEEAAYNKMEEQIAYAHLHLAYFDLDQELLLQAMQFARNNTWFFSWRSKKKQFSIITETYRLLKGLLTNTENNDA